MPRLATPIAERLWARVDRTNPDACWLWPGNRNNQGYGMISRAGGLSPALVHRVAWEATTGPIPSGLHVCHRCDTPLCCNPAHLFLGTDRANSDDKIAKGRHARGERHGNCRLTIQQVRRIRELRHTGVSQRVVAMQFDIAQSTVSRIFTGLRRREG